jgi:putative lipoic acid-binding regulatory protein
MKSRDEYKDILDHHHEWPTDYTFKFIVPKDSVKDVHAMFPGQTTQDRPSSGGKWVAVTFTKRVASADEILQIYDQARKIPHITAL